MSPNPIAFIVSLNLHRRHLDASQRAIVAARIENMRHGGNRTSRQDANLHLEVTREQAATLLNVGTRSVADAARVLNSGVPELVQAVDAGQASVSAAAVAQSGTIAAACRTFSMPGTCAAAIVGLIVWLAFRIG